MTNTTHVLVAQLAFLVAGISVLALTGGFLVYLTISWLRGGPHERRTIGQEIIWTLVPALVLVGLSVASQASRGAGTGHARSPIDRVQVSLW